MKAHILLGVSTFAILAFPAAAQTPAAEPVAAADSVEEAIIITGSRIARPNVDASVPVTTLTVAELTQSGEVALGDSISLLPSFRPTVTSQNSGNFIGTAGVATLDLRGQGTTRTLVLQNGRRHVTSTPGGSTVDINTIPIDLVERVDVVTGGNSAIYGSDAVAGVVNFIMKRDFEGIRARGQMGISSRGDRPTYFGSLTAGHNFSDGRGNIAANFEYSEQAPLFNFERDEQTGAFSGRRQLQLSEDTVGEPAAGNGIFDTTYTVGIKNAGISTGGAYTSSCAGSADRQALNCSGVFNTARTSQFGNVFVFQPDGTLVQNVGQKDFRPFGSGNFLGGQGSTLRETGLLQVGTKRYAGNLLASFEVNDAFRPFLEAKFVRTESIQEGQPTFSSGALNPTFRLTNPFLTDQARALLTRSLAPGATGFTMQRFNTDFGGRGENHERDLYRFVIGADGNFLDTWRYEVAFNYGRVDTFYQTRGNVNLANFTRAVNAVQSGANIVCAVNADADPANDDPKCAALNLFGQGRASQAALDYILVDSTREQWSDQMNAVAFVSGDLGKLFELPGGPVAFSVGGEWRKERSYSAFDEFTRSGGTFLNSIAIFNPPTLQVWEGFGELRVPILKDVPFFHELTLEGATRFSNYNVGGTGTVWAFNLGGVWSPVEDVRIRGGWARAIRAPTMTNLFAAQSQTFLNGLADPCGQQNINNGPNRVANCAAAGVPTTQTFNGITEAFTNRPTSGISGLNGGNPDLTEERSTSWSVGAVVRPNFVPGLIFTVDYYNIEITNAINTVGAQTVIDQCYDSPDGIDNQFCRAITRNPNGTFAGQQNVLHAGETVQFPLTGQSFLTGPFNYATQTTSGIDFDLAYRHPSEGDWSFGARAIVTYLIGRDNFTSIVEPNRATQQKLTLGDPEWAGQLRLNVGYKDFDFAWNMRYVGKQTVGTWAAQNVEQGRPPTNADQFPFVFYPDVSYHDIRIEKGFGDAKVYFGIDNLFDQLPPFDLLGNIITADGRSDAQFTNTGRFFYMGVDLRF
jgi:outer membrane receptor protein involved in Fe transport